jgi:hypothetical protein
VIISADKRTHAKVHCAIGEIKRKYLLLLALVLAQCEWQVGKSVVRLAGSQPPICIQLIVATSAIARTTAAAPSTALAVLLPITRSRLVLAWGCPAAAHQFQQQC